MEVNLNLPIGFGASVGDIVVFNDGDLVSLGKRIHVNLVTEPGPGADATYVSSEEGSRFLVVHGTKDGPLGDLDKAKDVSKSVFRR